MSEMQTFRRIEGGPLQLVPMDYHVVKIPASRLTNIWRHAAPYLIIGLGVAPELDIEQVIEGLTDESIQLWVVVDEATNVVAAFLTSIENDRGDWVVSLYALGGSEVRGWLAYCDAAMTVFAQQEGAKRVRMCGRKAWTRLLPETFAVTGQRGGHNIYERAAS